MKGVMRAFIILATFFLGIENVYAMDNENEEALLARRQQKIAQFLSSKESILEELSTIEARGGIEQRRHLRQFAYTNLNHYRSKGSLGRIYDICETFSEKQECNKKIIQLIRNKLDDDFQQCTTILTSKVLREGNFPDEDHWNYEEKFQPHDYITITHGGGLCYLLDCFEGKEIGYGLEEGGLGIQVHPSHDKYHNDKDQSPFYACDVMMYAFDFPVILAGNVQAQYLMPAINQYEAAIKVSNLRYVEGATLTFLTDDMIKKSKYCGFIPSFYKLIPQELQDRLEKFNKHSMQEGVRD